MSDENLPFDTNNKQIPAVLDQASTGTLSHSRYGKCPKVV